MKAQDERSYDARTLEATEDFVKYYRWVLAHVSPDIRGRTLEIGAGTGTMSRRIESLCSELVLVEPALNLGAILKQHFTASSKVTVCCDPLESAVRSRPDLFEPGFDTIVSFNVLEHIEDDVAVLRLAGQLLRPGGQVVLFVPSLPFLYGSIDAQVDHQRRYTKRSLAGVIDHAGLRLVHMEYFDLLGMVPWFIVGRILRRTTSGGGVKGYDRLVIPVCRAVDRAVGPPIGKNLIAVAGRLAT